jgi:hypothetical protein
MDSRGQEGHNESWNKQQAIPTRVERNGKNETLPPEEENSLKRQVRAHKLNITMLTGKSCDGRSEIVLR